jgi:flagellar secretion chaperone FliS
MEVVMNKYGGEQAYKNSAVPAPRIKDAHGAITVCLGILLHNLKILAEGPDHTSKLYGKIISKCLTAIYILQTSLDLEKGSVISDNLFKLYEYVKHQVMATSEKEAVNLDQAIEVVTEITTSWRAIS